MLKVCPIHYLEGGLDNLQKWGRGLTHLLQTRTSFRVRVVGWEMDRGEDPGYSIALGVETLGWVEGQECSKCLLNVLCEQCFLENILLIQPSTASIVLFWNVYLYEQTPVPKPCPQSCPCSLRTGRYTYFYCAMLNIICDLSYCGPFQITAKLCHLLWQAQAKDAGGLVLIRILTWKLMKGNMIFGWEK